MPIDLSRTSTFSDYFKLTADLREITHAFGYRLIRDTLDLTVAPVSDQAAVQRLQLDLQNVYRQIDIASEQARREFLIAPVLFLLAKLIPDLWISIEKYIVANEQLKGAVDYYLTATSNLIIIEAKNADIVNGMKQLSAELIALDILESATYPNLYGAVSIGDDWRFARLCRATKVITEDIKLYRVPEELERLLGVLLYLLQTTQPSPVDPVGAISVA